MAKKKGTALALGIAAIAAGGLYLWSTSASADQGDDDPNGPDWPGTGDEPGKGPGGSPKSLPGGDVYGDPPPGAGYLVPEDWDPIRGLWVSPDCEMVVEAPGWFCGSGGPDLETPQPFPGEPFCTAMPADTYAGTMDVPGNGVAGYLDFLFEIGMGPEEAAWQVLVEAAPECALDPADMPDGLFAWWEGWVARVVYWWEEYHGIEFEPDAA